MVDVPAPKPAQVIRYSYLWADEHEVGRDEGIKDRPVAVVLALQTDGDSEKVAVVPITHARPTVETDAIEIPLSIKRHLGLDDARSWVALTEINLFTWPGPDLRPISKAGKDTILYGYLPAGFFRTVRDRLTANIRAGKTRQVPRSE